jgi:hypothetical protein
MILGLASCSEDVTEFPDYEKDWFTIEDQPGDTVAHAIYQFYEQYRIPVFYNDTIGSQQRVDQWGHDYTYYKTLSLNFALGGLAASGLSPNVSHFTYCDKRLIPEVLRFLGHDIMPYVPAAIHIPSILLVEDMQSMKMGTEVYNGMTTFIIANASKLPGYGEQERKRFRAVVLQSLLSKYMVNNEEFRDRLETFYQVSRSLSSSREIYNLYTWYFNSTDMPSAPFDRYDYSVTDRDKMLWAGFLSTDPGNSYYSPSSTMIDLGMYIEAYFTYTEQEFAAMYGAYPNVMKKYTIIRPIIEKVMKP